MMTPGQRLRIPTLQHPTARLTAPWGDAVDIDVLLVPVIERLWAEGVRTYWSCQGYAVGEPRPNGRVTRGYITVRVDQRDLTEQFLPDGWPRWWDDREPRQLRNGNGDFVECVRFQRTPYVHGAE